VLILQMKTDLIESIIRSRNVFAFPPSPNGTKDYMGKVYRKFYLQPPDHAPCISQVWGQGQPRPGGGGTEIYKVL